MSVPRASWYRFRPFGEDGRLTVDAIEALIRRIWWGDDDTRWEPDGTRVKWVALVFWWSADRWPTWWTPGVWIDAGDGLEARTVTAGQGNAGRLEVRRRGGAT